jgi:hypothetical protein
VFAGALVFSPEILDLRPIKPPNLLMSHLPCADAPGGGDAESPVLVNASLTMAGSG